MIRHRIIVTTLCFLGICFSVPTQAISGTVTPQRVISLSPIITETIYLVGAQDHLIANTTYCNVPEPAKYKEKIGSVIQMNVEKIIRLNPDLVIASALSREKQLKILEKMSIKVIRAQNPKTFDQMCEMTLNLGMILGRTRQAQTVVNQARHAANTILAQTADLQKPSVFLQIGIKPLHSANKDMFINEYIRYAGGENIAAHEGSGVYSREKVVAMDPDVILVATMGTSKKAANLEKNKWMAHTAMKAVQQARIHVLDPEMICSPTPVTFVKGLQKILPLFHPGLKVIDPDKEEANASQS